MKNEPFTTEEHRETGEHLTRMWTQLLNLGATVTSRYPRSSIIDRRVSDAVAAVDALRQTLKRQAERDLGTDYHPSLYHPVMELVAV